MSKKAYTLIIVVMLVLALQVIWTGQRRYQATEIEKCIRNLQEYELPTTRAHAAKVLGQMGPAAGPAVPALIKALQHKELQVRRAAAGALGNIGPDPDAIRALVACLKDPKALARTQAAESLGWIGPPAKEAVSPLKKMLEDKEPVMRLAAAEALYRITNTAEPQLPVVISVLEERHGSMRSRAARVLGEMGPSAEEALPAMEAVLKVSQDPEVRKDIEDAIHKIRGKERL